MSRDRRRSGERRPFRVVLDTNAVVSALLFGQGPAAALRRMWLEGRIQPLVSGATVAELIRVLAYPKFRLSTQDQEELLGDYLPVTTVVRIPDPPPSVPRCRDPHDLPFLHLAAAGKADAIVTGDADLLALADDVAYRILTLAEILEGM